MVGFHSRINGSQVITSREQSHQKTELIFDKFYDYEKQTEVVYFYYAKQKKTLTRKGKVIQKRECWIKFSAEPNDDDAKKISSVAKDVLELMRSMSTFLGPLEYVPGYSKRAKIQVEEWINKLSMESSLEFLRL